MNNLLNVHEWTDEPANFFIHQYFMNGNEFPGWQMYEASQGNQPGNAFIRQYVWVNKADKTQAFKVDVIQAFSYEDAKVKFQELLDNNMRRLEEFKQSAAALGNNAYVMPVEEMNYGLFLLANMVIRVNSTGETDIACNDFVKALYNTLNKAYEENNVVAPGTESFYSSEGNEIPVGGTTVLNLQEPVWYKALIDGPGALNYRNGRLEYTSDEPGTARIDLYTIRGNAVAKSTLTLNVK